jgi:hypothetical protein
MSKMCVPCGQVPLRTLFRPALSPSTGQTYAQDPGEGSNTGRLHGSQGTERHGRPGAGPGVAGPAEAADQMVSARGPAGDGRATWSPDARPEHRREPTRGLRVCRRRLGRALRGGLRTTDPSDDLTTQTRQAQPRTRWKSRTDRRLPHASGRIPDQKSCSPTGEYRGVDRGSTVSHTSSFRCG